MHEVAPKLQDGKRRATNYSDSLWSRIRPTAKRLFDCGAAIVLIVIVLPLGCLITAGILMSGQSPFYSHVRIGRNGKSFGCLKFKSMRSDADAKLAQLLQRDPAARLEWQTNRKLQHDPRVTPIGRILRAASLDELPQLLNILMGQMSLVGPRPVTKEELKQFYGPADAAAYISVRPGLTGLWQVSGRCETSYSNRVALDTLYAQRLSLRADLVILFQTIEVVVGRKGAW